MGAHAAAPGHASRVPGHTSGTSHTSGTAHASRASWGIPLTLGVVYGVYIAFMARGSSPLTWANVGLGVLCGVIMTAIAYGVGKAGKRLGPGQRALSFAVPFGAGMGFLFSLGGASILTSVVYALALFAGMLVASYYAFYSHAP
ncbi:hypothetical protein ACH4SP_14180 [Streptomyces sp. NPDC021093]|uniref:hypothetical protein n=1 Tax=Streptomyces sp. NPDC021093 TaxID=3365112 RepID=UPI00379CE029